MRKLIICFFSFLLFFSAALAYSSDPKEFVNELVNDAISLLSDKSATKEKKEDFIKTIALENVDINALGLYT